MILWNVHWRQTIHFWHGVIRHTVKAVRSEQPGDSGEMHRLSFTATGTCKKLAGWFGADSLDNCFWVKCISNLTTVTSADERIAYSRALVSSRSSMGTISGAAITRIFTISIDGGSRTMPSSPSKSSLQLQRSEIGQLRRAKSCGIQEKILVLTN